MFEGSSRFVDKFTEIATSEPAVGLLAALSLGLKSKAERDSLIKHMQGDLLDRLFNSDLVALGKRQRPSKSPYAVSIDADFFEFAVANWNLCTVECHGKLYSGVRVYDPNAELANPQVNQSKGSIGAIDLAIAELKLEISEFCTMPRKLAAQLVREKLGQLQIDGNGLSVKNISKRILLQCPIRAIRINSN